MKKFTLFSLLLLVSCFTFTSKVFSQCATIQDSVLDFSKNPSVFFQLGDVIVHTNQPWYSLLVNAPILDVFNVSGHVRYQDNFIKADLVTFSAGSTLEFMKIDAEFWAIVTKKLIFQGENITITRNTSYTFPQPSSASQGSSGAHRPHGHQAHGSAGGRGSTGKKGDSTSLPCLLIIAQEIEFGDNDLSTISFRLQGIDGGPGGDGGRGGNGGSGGHGHNASMRWIKCAREPGDGGNGGNAGPGGRGGDGGDGGRGGDIIFIGNQDQGEILMSVQILNESGKPGRPGNGGSSGTPGSGGHKGSRKGTCQRTAYNGKKGSDASSGSTGNPGLSGQRGIEQIIVVPDLSSFFEPLSSENLESSQESLP